MTAAAASAAPSASATSAGTMPFRAPDDVAMPLGAVSAPWLLLVLLLAMGAYSLFTIAAMHALLMALLERHLHRPALAGTERGGLNGGLDCTTCGQA